MIDALRHSPDTKTSLQCSLIFQKLYDSVTTGRSVGLDGSTAAVAETTSKFEI